MPVLSKKNKVPASVSLGISQRTCSLLVIIGYAGIQEKCQKGKLKNDVGKEILQPTSFGVARSIDL